MTDSPNLALLIETLIADAIFLRGEGMNKIAADCDEAVTLLRAQPSGDWVMVSERLPDDSRPVLIHACEGDSDWDAVACFKGTNWRGTKVYRYTKEMVDRWMPLPPPPALSAAKERNRP